jgi:hypothetical protein
MQMPICFDRLFRRKKNYVLRYLHILLVTGVVDEVNNSEGRQATDYLNFGQLFWRTFEDGPVCWFFGGKEGWRKRQTNRIFEHLITISELITEVQNIA